FSVIAPMVLDIYTFMGVRPLVVLDTSILPFIVIAAIATLGDAAPQLRRTFAVLSVVLFGLLVSYVLQRKGWDYHLLPFNSMSLIGCLMAGAASSHSAKTRPLHFVVFAVLPIVLLIRTINFPRYENPYSQALAEKLHEIKPDWRGTSIIVL